MKTLLCHGACGREKAIVHFTPTDQKLSHPVCASCRKEARKKYRVMPLGRPRGWGFRENAAVLCPGSGFRGGARA